MSEKPPVMAMFKSLMALTNSSTTIFSDEIGFSQSAVQNVLANRRSNITIERAVSERLGHPLHILFPHRAPSASGDDINSNYQREVEED
jgi:antitoxin component HigA of HigAB toxin-antitoxin module